MQKIAGVQVNLRLVTPADAAYIHALRRDPRYNAHLSAVTGGVQDQRAWIERYQQREAAGREFYYIIERCLDGLPCGVARLYDITDTRFTWGSWILDQNKPPLAALESAVLSFAAAFDHLGVKLADIDVRKRNSRAIAFYRRFGMSQIRDDDQNIYFEYTRARFEADRAAHLQAIKANAGRGMRDRTLRQIKRAVNGTM